MNSIIVDLQHILDIIEFYVTCLRYVTSILQTELVNDFQVSDI